MPNYTDVDEDYTHFLTKAVKALKEYDDKNKKIKANFGNEDQVPLGTNFDGGGFRKVYPNEKITKK